MQCAKFYSSLSSENFTPPINAIWGKIVLTSDDFFSRLESLRNPDETRTDFCKRIKISRRTYYHWEKRTHRPNLKDVEDIADILNVNRSWLGFGEGPMKTE